MDKCSICNEIAYNHLVFSLFVELPSGEKKTFQPVLPMCGKHATELGLGRLAYSSITEVRYRKIVSGTLSDKVVQQ